MTLLVYKRKSSTFIKEQNASTYGDVLEIGFGCKGTVESSYFKLKQNQWKPKLTENIPPFKIQLIRWLIYLNQLNKL